jgi:hypothetical protein
MNTSEIVTMIGYAQQGQPIPAEVYLKHIEFMMQELDEIVKASKTVNLALGHVIGGGK